jgi:dihydroorotate dehydrogenase
VSDAHAADWGTTLAGVRLPFPAMNAAGSWSSTAGELRDLARSGTGAIVVRTATVHPFVHQQYRTLHNPGFDKLVPLVRDLAALGAPPVIPSIAGATVDEYVTLARAFAEAGAALIEANLADPYVEATLAPFDDPGALAALLGALVGAASVPVSVKLPNRPRWDYRVVGEVLRDAGVRVIVVKNDFAGLEKLMVETERTFDVVAFGGIRSGYDVTHTLGKGARAVQVDTALVSEGPRVFARLAREMGPGRGVRG